MVLSEDLLVALEVQASLQVPSIACSSMLTCGAPSSLFPPSSQPVSPPPLLLSPSYLSSSTCSPLLPPLPSPNCRLVDRRVLQELLAAGAPEGLTATVLPSACAAVAPVTRRLPALKFQAILPTASQTVRRSMPPPTLNCTPSHTRCLWTSQLLDVMEELLENHDAARAKQLGSPPQLHAPSPSSPPQSPGVLVRAGIRVAHLPPDRHSAAAC